MLYVPPITTHTYGKYVIFLLSDFSHQPSTITDIYSERINGVTNYILQVTNIVYPCIYTCESPRIYIQDSDKIQLHYGLVTKPYLLISNDKLST